MKWNVIFMGENENPLKFHSLLKTHTEENWTTFFSQYWWKRIQQNVNDTTSNQDWGKCSVLFRVTLKKSWGCVFEHHHFTIHPHPIIHNSVCTPLCSWSILSLLPYVRKKSCCEPQILKKLYNNNNNKTNSSI